MSHPTEIRISAGSVPLSEISLAVLGVANFGDLEFDQVEALGDL